MNHTLSRMKLMLKEVTQEKMETNASTTSMPSKDQPPSNTLDITGFLKCSHNLSLISGVAG